MTQSRSRQNPNKAKSASPKRNRSKPQSSKASRATQMHREPPSALNPLTVHLRAYAEADYEAFAYSTFKSAKQGHKRSLELVHESLARTSDDHTDHRDQVRNSTPFEIGALQSLDDIADAQRRVLIEVASGVLNPADASRITTMLIELRQTILDIDIPRRIAALQDKINAS